MHDEELQNIKWMIVHGDSEVKGKERKGREGRGGEGSGREGRGRGGERRGVEGRKAWVFYIIIIIKNIFFRIK